MRGNQGGTDPLEKSDKTSSGDDTLHELTRVYQDKQKERGN